MVQNFYNIRRKQVLEASPNAAHFALVKLEEKFNVTIITQNIDDLHERAGSSNVMHLHGEIIKAQSSIDPTLVYPIDGWKLKKGKLCEKGSQLRPHVVWFGETVPKMTEAAAITETADIMIIVGTSLNVYPAAGLVDFARNDTVKYLVDPNEVSTAGISNVFQIRENAGSGVTTLVKKLLKS